MSRLLHIFIIISCLKKAAEGNVRFVCPAPMSPKSDFESGSCDLDAALPNKDVTILQAGLFTVTFEETKFQPNSPFRITLLDNSQKYVNVSNTNTTAGTLNNTRQSCLLLDHIPHNNKAVITAQCSKKGNDYPLGICSESTYHITIRVPDVVCEDCILMLQQVVANQEHQACEVTKQNGTFDSTNCTTYTSCARVRIRPTVTGAGKDLDHCSDYLSNLAGDWPYRPQDLFQTEEKAVLTLDLLHKDLHIEIPRDGKLGPIERVEIRHNVTNIWNVTVTNRDNLYMDGTVKVAWRSLTDTDIETLKDGQLVLNIVGSESMAADIVYITQHFSEDRLSSLHDLYSETGWLISDKFLGPYAEDPAAAVPWGECVPEAIYFMTFLKSTGVTSHGILGMTILENRAYVTAVLHVEKEIVQTIRFKGPDLVAIPMIEIAVPSSFNGVLQAAFDISEQLPFMDTVRFFKTVEVETDKEDAVLTGDFEEGMYTVLRDEVGDIHGMGAFQFTMGQWLRVEVVLNDLPGKIQSAWLHGPGSELVDLKRETTHCTQAFCCIDAMIHEVTSELLLNLMKGQLVVHVTVQESSVSGQVLGSPLRYCQMVDGICESKFHKFSVSGLGIGQHKGGNEQANSSQWTAAEAYVLDRANVLYYCVQIDNLNMGGKLFTGGLMKMGSKIDSVTFEPLEELSKSYIACNQIPLDESHPFVAPLAEKNQKSLDFVINKGSQPFLSLDLPTVVRGGCVVSKIHEVGKDKDHWSPESAPLADIYAVVSDKLRFIFSANTTLFLMESKEAMKSCNFETAKKLLPANVGEDKGEYYFSGLNQTESLYFADLGTCNSTSRSLKLIVHVIDAGSQVLDFAHDEQCSKSVYSIWRNKQLLKWEEPAVTGPVVIGLVVGLSSAGAFLLWQGIRMKRIPDGFRSSNDNVFVRF